MCQPEDLPQTATKMYETFDLLFVTIGQDQLGLLDLHLPESVQQTLRLLAFDGLINDKCSQ